MAPHRGLAYGAGTYAPIAGTIETTPEMWRTAKRVGTLTRELIERAQSAGVLRADVTSLDISLLIEQLGRRGPTEPSAEDDSIRARLLAIALDGLPAPGTDPLPGRPPSARRYEARWKRQLQ